MNMQEARTMVEGLRGTATKAPEGLADAVMAEVGLNPDYMQRYPHE